MIAGILFTRKVRASQGKGAGQLPVEATLRIVQQKQTAKLLAMVER